MPPVVVTHLPFPGRTLKAGETNPELVLALQRQLNAAGCGPLVENGRFAEDTVAAVKRFQMRFPDVDGVPLKVDGAVGPLTWAALFGVEPAAADPAPAAVSLLGLAAIEAARAEIGVREEPPGSNRGRRVDEYLRGVGLDPGGGSFAWCAAFVYFCFGKAAAAAGRRNPLTKTAGVLAHWNRAETSGARRIKKADAAANPSLVRVGQIFCIDFGGGAGHTGIVTGIQSGKLLTIEGNTNDGGSRDGIGVFARQGRTIGSINKGFLDYV